MQESARGRSRKGASEPGRVGGANSWLFETARQLQRWGNSASEGMLRADTWDKSRSLARRVCVLHKGVDSKKDGSSSDSVRSDEG